MSHDWFGDKATAPGLRVHESLEVRPPEVDGHPFGFGGLETLVLWRRADIVAMGMWRRDNGREIPNERHWSAHTNTSARDARADLVPYTPLPAETGPVWAPDRLSVWPVEGGRFGIDAHYHGVTGVERAHVQQSRLQKIGLEASVKQDADGGLIRIGPLAHAPTWLALEAFLGRPL